MHIFIYNGISTREYCVTVSGEDTWAKAAPDLNSVTIPGRNGELLLSNKRYNNVAISYNCGITRQFERDFTGFASQLLAAPGYHRLEDSYHPEYFRMAAITSGITPSMTALNHAGQFSVSFTCKPQMYFKSGEYKQEFTVSGGTLFNPSVHTAKPLIRVYGTGTLSIGDSFITINSADGYTDIDCDMQECYKGTVNCNGNVTLVNGEFPELHAGSNGVTFDSGITKVEITPRWWTL